MKTANLIDLSGAWVCDLPGFHGWVRLPGTLDENGIGAPDDPSRQWQLGEVRRIGFWREGDPIVTRLTRKHRFEGAALFSRRVAWEVPEGKRAFLEAERARHLRLLVNGTEAFPCRPATLSAPCAFEVTELVTGRDLFELISDNSYPGWPREAIVYASAASDETQTNWNGLLGFLRLRMEEKVFISRVRVLPFDNEIRVDIEMDAASPWQGELRLSCEALKEDGRLPVRMKPGRRTFSVSLPVREGARRWDLEEGNLYHLTVSAEGLAPRTVRFGLRAFAARDGYLTLNGRRVFLRSEANCAVFPETGYAPMDTAAWKAILEKYLAYGVNCLRFHSHCPPEAAFTAADELGMLMQPELSHWDPQHAFGSEEARRYYRSELQEILLHLANHPSFVMLTFGNELQADDEGHAFIRQLLGEARALDPTRLYAGGSNPHYGQRGTDPASDFYTAMSFRGREMRATCDGMTGWLNHEPPNTCHDYRETVAEIRKETDQPVFSFEVGQYEILPDFDEIGRYRGVTSPENLRHIRRKVREKGLEEDWKRRVEATGESSLLCYRAEVEAALRTGGYSGISLLGLQDFPGQGTALVGMMNAHLIPKPYAFADPARFAAFFRDTLPLVLLERFTYPAGETLRARIRLAHYGKQPLRGRARWRLEGDGFLARGELAEVSAPAGALTDLGSLSVPLQGLKKAARLNLTVDYRGHRNEYPLWVYPDEEEPICPASVLECRAWDETAREALRRGGIVYLAPDSTEEALPRSIQAQFSPDFWSVCTFPHQTGCMGLLIDESHPLFRNFPTESFGNWQWHPMAGRRALLLPEPIECIVAEMDSYAFMRPMAMLFECRCGAGRLLVSSLGLHEIKQRPEARALQRAIYDYLSSDRFQPRQSLTEGWISSLFL